MPVAIGATLFYNKKPSVFITQPTNQYNSFKKPFGRDGALKILEEGQYLNMYRISTLCRQKLDGQALLIRDPPTTSPTTL